MKSKNAYLKYQITFEMKRPRCKTCRHTMRGHKKQKCATHSTIVFEDGRVYSGSSHDNIPSGYGKMQYPNGDTYMGEFLKGEFHGQGEQRGQTIGHYVGEWHHGVRQGDGRWERSDGKLYEGSFKRDLYHGTGTLFVRGRVQYRGEWLYGTYHGRGRLTVQDGSYLGEFVHHQRHGFGEQTYTVRRSVYTGGWRSDMRHGAGAYTDPTGTYTGAFSNDLRNGHGKFVAVDGATYLGNWRHGKRHRRGTQTYADGSRYVGGWSRGRRTGHGQYVYPNGDTYVGFWLHGQRHGRGTWTTSTIVFKGQWEDDLLVGVVVEVTRAPDASWSSRSGSYVRGQRHGVFHVVEAGGGTNSELWIHGRSLKFSGLAQARKRTRTYLKQQHWSAAEAVCTFYPDIVSWNFIYRNDREGHLVHMLEHDNMLNALAQKAGRLFRKGRYLFLEACMACCTEEELDRMASDDESGALFDSLTKTFVANPWMVLHASYTDSTKRKLLEGLHLGELGRCPPLDPFTRQPLHEKSGAYLSTRPKVAKRVYKAFARTLLNDTPVVRLAYQFDLQDFERDLANARAVSDVDTIRRLIRERNAFMARSGAV